MIPAVPAPRAQSVARVDGNGSWTIASTTSDSSIPVTSIVNSTAIAEWSRDLMPPMKSDDPQAAEAARAKTMPTPGSCQPGLHGRIDEVDHGLHGICGDGTGDRQRPHGLGNLRPCVMDR